MYSMNRLHYYFLALSGIIWHYLALLFGIIWHYLALFEHTYSTFWYHTVVVSNARIIIPPVWYDDTGTIPVISMIYQQQQPTTTNIVK